MRNAGGQLPPSLSPSRARIRRRPSAGVVLLCAAAWAGGSIGCSVDNGQKQERAAVDALQHQQYDQALANADESLKASATGVSAAEAMFVRGVAYQERTKADPAAKSQDLQEAREAYIAALKRSPAPPLEALIRANLGTVAYLQEDYALAVDQLALAYDKLAKPADKAGALYRLGVAQQRLGRFADADATFAAVQQQFPEDEKARWARYHAGARSFFVRFGAFSSPQQAEAVARRLAAGGVPAACQPDPAKGLHYVQVAVGDYRQAQALKARVAASYPQAMIVP